MITCEELEDLIPAYVLGAVDEADRALVEAHLPRCANCRQLVKDYGPVVELLPFAAQQVEPRAELRYRVLAGMTGTLTASSIAQPERAKTSAGMRSGTPAPSWISRVADMFAGVFRSPAFSALALVLVIAFGIWNLMLQNQLTQQAAETRQMAEELGRQRNFLTTLAYSDSAPRRLWGTETASKAVGRLYGGPDEFTFVMVTYDLPKLPAGKVYQLWLVDPSGNRASGGTFTVDEEGRGWLFSRAPQGLGNYKTMGVTIEPFGGSPGPTGAKMLGGNL
ncbi:MAG: anti-sigma factor domain-containing protein [Acidobacteriota bacterium]